MRGKMLLLACVVVGLLAVAVGLGFFSGSLEAQGLLDTKQGDITNRSPDAADSPQTGSDPVVAEALPAGPDVDQVKATVETGWRLRLEAGLDRNRGVEADYKEQLRQYYSAVPLGQTDATSDVALDALLQVTPQPPSEKAGQVDSEPFEFASPGASELEKQWNYIDAGRYNERMSNFRVMDFGIDSLTYLRIRIDGDKAEVVVDIVFWSEFLRTNPDGGTVTSRPHAGQRHTFLLAREAAGWRITSDTFTILPGYEP